MDLLLPGARTGWTTGTPARGYRLLDAAACRVIDILLAVVLLLVAAPALALIALAIRLDSPGPATFRQERVGRHGRRFRMWKLRTMYVGNDEGVHRAMAAAWFRGDGSTGGYRTTRDPRVTRVGRVLRATNLDEVPQLLNVLTGDMSLVGPRPALPYELAHYEASYFDRLRCRPGITGLWQISDRDRRSAPEMMALDLAYVDQATAWMNLKILARTVPVVLADAGGLRRR